jgi:hypothetical protein
LLVLELVDEEGLTMRDRRNVTIVRRSLIRAKMLRKSIA